MLGRIVKFRRGDKYEDLEGSSAGLETDGRPGGSTAGVLTDAEGLFRRRTDSTGQNAAANANANAVPKEIAEGKHLSLHLSTTLSLKTENTAP